MDIVIEESQCTFQRCLRTVPSAAVRADRASLPTCVRRSRPPLFGFFRPAPRLVNFHALRIVPTLRARPGKAQYLPRRPKPSWHLGAQASRSRLPGRLPGCRTVPERHRFLEPRIRQHFPAGDPRVRGNASRFRYQPCLTILRSALVRQFHRNALVARLFASSFPSACPSRLATSQNLLHAVATGAPPPGPAALLSPGHTSTPSLWTSPPEASGDYSLSVSSVLSTACRLSCITPFSCSPCVGLPS